MITVIGYDGSPLGSAASAALGRATLVVGGQRNLDGVAVASGVRRIVLGDVDAGLAELASYDGDAVVVASGDPGFFGIVRRLRERGLPVAQVLPAVSSVALAFARVRLPWEDAVVVSMHGRDPRRALNVARARHKVVVLTGPGAGPVEIGRALVGWCRSVVVAERLGTPDERVTRCTPAEAAAGEWRDPNVVLVLHHPPHSTPAPNPVQNPLDPWDGRSKSTFGPAEAPGEGSSGGGEGCEGPSARRGGASSDMGWCYPTVPRRGGWALPENAFAHRNSMITKAEVRALVLARLGPGLGDLVWDIGAGSGAVAVECARLGAAVVAVDRDPAAATLVAANAASYDVDVLVRTGTAPGMLVELPDPDAVFVGGGGAAVVGACAARGPRVVVVALAALDRVPPVQQALHAAGYAVDGVLLQCSRLADLPDGGTRLAPTNPVFVLWGQR